MDFNRVVRGENVSVEGLNCAIAALYTWSVSASAGLTKVSSSEPSLSSCPVKALGVQDGSARRVAKGVASYKAWASLGIVDYLLGLSAKDRNFFHS